MKTGNNNPLISIIMPVYNAEAYIEKAVQSILSQTYSNFELIIVNDASTDDSLTLVRNLAKKDKRIKIINSLINQGPSGAANLGLIHAKGHFVARMDADDIMPIKRLEWQIEYLQKNQNVVVVGGQVELITVDEKPICAKKFPTIAKEVLIISFLTIPIQQGAMMVNRDLLPKDFLWYRKELKCAEDLDFLLRAFKYGKGVNLPQIVLYYRQYGVGESQSQAEHPKEIFFKALLMRVKALISLPNLTWYQRILIAGKLFIQATIVLLLPTKLIYPIYYLWRGMLQVRMPRRGLKPILRYAKQYVF